MDELPLADLIDNILLKLNSGEEDKFADCYHIVGMRLVALHADPNYDIDPAIYHWLLGAEQVNRGLGAFSDFIRSYTSSQYYLRKDAAITNEQLQAASNDIAMAVLQDIISSGGAIPTLAGIGNNDITGTATALFDGDAAGWSGCILFPILGENIFLENHLLNETSDTYNAVAALHAASAAFAGTISNFSLSNVLLAVQQALSIAISMPISTLVSVAEAVVDYSTYFTSAYGFVGDITHYRAGSLQLADDLVMNGSHEMLNAGGGDDYISAIPNYNVIDGGSGEDALDYSGSAQGVIPDAINVVIEDLLLFTTSVKYTGYVESLSSENYDYIYNVEAIIGTSRNDTFTVNNFTGNYENVYFDGQLGEDSLTVTQPDDVSISRLVSFGGVWLLDGTFDRAINCDGIEIFSIQGKAPDTLMLYQPWEDTQPVRTVDLGEDGLVLDDNGGWLRDALDASELTAGVEVDLGNISDQTVDQNGTLLVRMKNVNSVIGTHYDDTIHGAPDGGYLSGGMGNDFIYGGGDIDTITGGGGSDFISAGAGDDIIFVGNQDYGGNVEYAYGDGGDDIFVIDSVGLLEIAGGSGNDTYFSAGDHGANLIFQSGDGNDRVQGHGVEQVHFMGVNLSELKLVWNAQQISQDGYITEWVGDIAVVVKSTGESVLFENTLGYTNNQNQIMQGNIRLPMIVCEDGLLLFDDGGIPVDLEFGDTSAYAPAPRYVPPANTAATTFTGEQFVNHDLSGAVVDFYDSLTAGGASELSHGF